MTVNNAEFVLLILDYVRDNESGILSISESQDLSYRVGSALNLMGGPAQTSPE
jgi:hypothetical protein